METRMGMQYSNKLCQRSYPTYEEWKQLNPTSNGACISCSYPTYEEWKHYFHLNTMDDLPVLILPMRNGNSRSFCHRSIFFLSLSSYPTYEEWKQGIKIIKTSNGIYCSYPTYEEWKLSSTNWR